MFLDGFTHIDGNTKQHFQITSEVFEQTEEIEASFVRLDIHEKIDVTLDIGLTASNRPEDAHVGCVVASGDL
jgi:hypothetical protein